MATTKNEKIKEDKEKRQKMEKETDWCTNTAKQSTPQSSSVLVSGVDLQQCQVIQGSVNQLMTNNNSTNSYSPEQLSLLFWNDSF